MVSFGDGDRAAHFLFVVLKDFHIQKLFAVALNPAEVFVHPDDNVSPASTFSELAEAVQRVGKRLAASDYSVHKELLAGGAQQLVNIILQDVVPERNKRGRAVVHNENSVVREQVLHESVESPLVDAALT